MDHENREESTFKVIRGVLTTVAGMLLVGNVTYFTIQVLSSQAKAADLVTDLPEKILSQCGLVAALLTVAIIYLAAQLAKTRSSWESDRSGMMKLIEAQNDAYDKIATSHSRLEGIILALQTRNAG